MTPRAPTQGLRLSLGLRFARSFPRTDGPGVYPGRHPSRGQTLAPARASRPVYCDDESGDFGGVEKCCDVADDRATRYFAKCHWRSLSCGRAPGGTSLAGAIFVRFAGLILAAASDGQWPPGRGEVHLLRASKKKKQAPGRRIPPLLGAAAFRRPTVAPAQACADTIRGIGRTCPHLWITLELCQPCGCERETGEHRDNYPLDPSEYRLLQIEAQARRVIASIEGAKIAGGVDLWIALWDLRALLLDIDSDEFDLPRPGGIS